VSHDKDDIEASHPCATESGADQACANSPGLMLWMNGDRRKRQRGRRAALARDSDPAETDGANDVAPLDCRQRHRERTRISKRVDQLGFVGTSKCRG
jgi:hypothetical protein